MDSPGGGADPLIFCRPYLRLRESQRGRQLGPLRQRQVLRALEPPLQLLDLQRGVDGPRLAHLLALAVDPRQLAILDALLDVVCGNGDTTTEVKAPYTSSLISFQIVTNVCVKATTNAHIIHKHYITWRQM